MNAHLSNKNDQTLWQAFKLGDEAAFALLYQHNVRTLYAYGKKLTGKDDLVKDTVQDLFIDLWQYREKLADVESPKFYLFRSLRRRIYSAITQANNSTENWEHLAEYHLPTTNSAEYEFIQEEKINLQKATLQSWMKDLPVRHAEVLSLRYYHNFSYAEISELLSINEQSVRNIAQRAILRMRKLAIPLSLIIIFIIFQK